MNQSHRGPFNWRRRECRHDWIPLVHPIGARTELLGIDCDRCGAYYGHRSPFNDFANAQKLGDLPTTPVEAGPPSSPNDSGVDAPDIPGGPAALSHLDALRRALSCLWEIRRDYDVPINDTIREVELALGLDRDRQPATSKGK